MTFPVDWVDNVTTDQQARTRDLHDRGGDVYCIVHHSVTRRIQDTIATFWSDREVSATWAIGPTVAGSDDIKIALTVPENRRPWTTASSLDDKALTMEVCDQELGGNYPVSANAKEKIAQIVAYMHREYGMPMDRTHVLSHAEAYARGYGSYATACAGPDLNASLDGIVARARQIDAGATSTPSVPKDQEDVVSLIRVIDLPAGVGQPVYLVAPEYISHLPNPSSVKVQTANFAPFDGIHNVSTAEFNDTLARLNIPIRQDTVFHYAASNKPGLTWSRLSELQKQLAK